MSLSRCIPDLREAGQITDEQAARVQQTYDEIRTELRGSMAEDAADAIASTRTVDALEYEAARKRANKLRQVQAQRRMDDWLTRGGENWGRGGRGGDTPPPGEGPTGPVNPRAARTLLARMEVRADSVRKIALRTMDQLLADHHTNVAGQLRNPAQMDEIGRAAFGEDAPLAARELADGWAQAAEYQRQRANASGANIGKIKNWGLPQVHDSRAVQRAGFEQWFADERPRWDLKQMIDRETGQPFTEAGLRRAARYMFESIASEGALHRQPGTGGRRAMANRLGEHRVIFYKSYDDWKASREQYGRGTAYDAMMGHLKGMARSIAAMEILGPNPEAGIRYLKDRVTGDEALFEPDGLRKRDQASKNAAVVQRLWDEYTGILTQPENRNMALAFGAYRAVATGAKLGSAAITALGDLGTGMATARFNGLPQAKLIQNYVEQLDPTSKAGRQQAARLGFAVDTWIDVAAGQHRFLAEELTGEISRRVADGVLRASGLNILTDAGRAGNGKLWFGHVTDQRGKKFGDLEPAFRAALSRYGIGEQAWDHLRKTPLEEDRGADWILPWNVKDQEIGNRLHEMALNETDFAVPVPDLETRAYINANARRGQFLGEMIRSSPLMFKTFTVGLMMRHGGRMMDQPGLRKMEYLLRLVIPMTLMGALSVQLKEIAKGRDPRPMEDPQFWGHALVMGGGMGIVGDVLGITAENRYMGMGQLAAGPLVTDFGRLAAAGRGMGANALNEAGFDVDRQRGAEWDAANALRQNIPGQNLWYARLAIDRFLADQIQQEIDPDYRRSWRQVERRAREQGQDFWWGLGETEPERAPDLNNLLANSPTE